MKKKTNYLGLVTLAAVSAAFFTVNGQENRASLEMADALEHAIYLQEGKADLDSAIRAYQGILEDGDLIDSIAAEARYRLAGVYLDQGKTVLGQKLLDEIVQKYPGEEHWVAEAKALLPQEFVPTITPWHDGERVHYDWKLATGDVMGRSFSTLSRYEWEGRKLWRKEARYVLNGNRATAVEFDPETFASVYSNMQLGEIGNVRAWYAEDGKSVKVTYAKSGEERSFDFAGPVFDNEQAYELMRQLPVEVGYKMAKTIFVSFSGTPVEITFEVVGIQEMDTALGSLECYEVSIDMIVQKQSAFITTDDRRLLVKMKVGGVEAVLSSVETVDYDGVQRYVNPKSGYSIELPGSWGVIEPPRTDETVFLAEPMARGEFILSSRPNTKWDEDESMDLDAFAKMMTRELKEDLKGFTQQTDWIADKLVSGLQTKGLKFVKEGADDGEVAHCYLAINDTMHYAVIARVPNGDAEELLPIFDSILESLKIGK